MLNALRMMRTKNKYHERYHTLITARVYENLKTEYAALQSILLTGEGNGFYGKHHTEEAKRRISAANKGRIQPPEEKAKQIAAFTSKKKLPLSAEHKEKS